MAYKNLQFPSDSVFLVTGGAGFIGSNLCEAILKMGYRVRCLDNFSTGKAENISEFIGCTDFELIRGDITDYNVCFSACEGADYVLHQAAWGSVPRSIEMPLEYELNNISGTLNMLEAARRNSIKKFVYASSSSVYGSSEILPKKEGEEGSLLSPYALTKKANEYYAFLYSSLYQLPTYGLRYFNVFGKKQDPDGAYAAVIPKFLKQLVNGECPTINGDGQQSRDFTYIENVIEANLKACAATEQAAGNTFNIAFGGQVTLIDVYHILVRALGKDTEPVFGPERAGDVKHSKADISKARRMLGYNPEYSFSEGIELAIDWYKDNIRE